MSIAAGFASNNAQRARWAREGLRAFFAAAGRVPVGPDERFGPDQVKEVISALLHYLGDEDCPAEVIARAVVDYDDQARAEKIDWLDLGFREIGGQVIAAVLIEADKDEKTSAMNTLLWGQIFYNEQLD